VPVVLTEQMKGSCGQVKLQWSRKLVQLFSLFTYVSNNTITVNGYLQLLQTMMTLCPEESHDLG
jgi:hypothetical protein